MTPVLPSTRAQASDLPDSATTAADPSQPLMTPRVLFLTRKFPPRIGGLETHSYYLSTGYAGPKRIVSLGKSQLHLAWFLPWVCLVVLFSGFRYDVIHLHDPMLAVAGKLARLWRRKVVMCLHGLDLLYPSALYQTYLKLFLDADAYVANSETTRRIALERGLTQVSAIGIGVSPDFFAIARGANPDPEVEAARKGRMVVLTIGRLIPRKGVAWFVSNVLPLLDVLYVVAGSGRDAERIRQAAAAAGVTERLLMLNETPQERLYRVLSSADAFVMPNIPILNDVEGFGIVSIEAAASGLPVVAAGLEGILDALSDGNSGTLVAPGVAAGYLEVLGRYASHPSERTTAGERGRAWVKQHNDWQAIVKQHTAVFAKA